MSAWAPFPLPPPALSTKGTSEAWGGGGGELGEANCPRYKLATAEIYGRLFSEPHNYIPHKFLWPGGPRAFEVGSPFSFAILTSDFLAGDVESP